MALAHLIDYYAAYHYPNFAVVPANTTYFTLNITIVDDSVLENSELVRIVAIPPRVPDGHLRCLADLVIVDDDGKLLSYVSLNIV